MPFDHEAGDNRTGDNMNDLRVLDVTLREGEQRSDVRFAAEDKREIVRRLERFGVDFVEVGHAAVSNEDFKACAAAASAASSAEVVIHARACPDEVHAAAHAGADWVGIWAGVNARSREGKFNGRSVASVHERVAEAVRTATGRGLRVRYTIEDASRTDTEAVLAAAAVALDAGAARISLADTVGAWQPAECAEAVASVREALSCEVEVHCHDDLGLALGNCLAAIDAGATVVDAAVLGLGERVGITDLGPLAVALRRFHGDDRYRLDDLAELTQVTARAAGVRIDPSHPLVGRNAFTHTSPYHVKAVEQDPESYELLPPEALGRARILERERARRPEPRLRGGVDIRRPFVKGASELAYHRDGVGTRWVLLDQRVDPRAQFYVMQRTIVPAETSGGTPDPHVDVHVHHCDSALVFMGTEADGTGLRCEALVDGVTEPVDSPATVYVPAGAPHTYRILDGAGYVLNIVLAPDYHSSLPDLPANEEPGAAARSTARGHDSERW